MKIVYFAWMPEGNGTWGLREPQQHRRPGLASVDAFGRAPCPASETRAVQAIKADPEAPWTPNVMSVIVLISPRTSMATVQIGFQLIQINRYG